MNECTKKALPIPPNCDTMQYPSHQKRRSPVKVITILFLLLLASPAFGELTKEDIRTIFKEENTASEKRIKEYIDLKIETVNARIDAVEKNLNDKIDAMGKSLDRVWYMMIGLIGLITAAIAVPQIIIAFKERGQKEMQTQIDQLRKELEAMQQ